MSVAQFDSMTPHFRWQSFISALSGLWGVLVTDLFQFVLKMTMVIILAVAAVHAVGGISQMELKLSEIHRAGSARRA